jgi:hypothetical protein
MKYLFVVGFGLLVSGLSLPANAQEGKKSEEEFVKEKPTIGDKLPELTVYSPDGKEMKTSSLRGHHTVLVFGCLT